MEFAMIVASISTSATVSKQGGTNSRFHNKKKCDALGITSFGGTSCCVPNEICREEDCSGRWISLEKQSSKASKADMNETPFKPFRTTKH